MRVRGAVGGWFWDIARAPSLAAKVGVPHTKNERNSSCSSGVTSEAFSGEKIGSRDPVLGAYTSIARVVNSTTRSTVSASGL